jgi:hypothetical protein
MKRRPRIITLAFIILLIASLIFLVEGQNNDHHPCWDKEINDMLDYISQCYDSKTKTFSWRYPKDEDKYQLFFQISKKIQDLIREQYKDKKILNTIIDPQEAAKTLIHLIDVWNLDYSINTQSMFAILVEIKIASQDEVSTIVSSFTSHLRELSVKIGQKSVEFKSVQEVKSFVEINSFSRTISSVNWKEVSETLKIHLKGETSPFTLVISLWDCLDALYNHLEISKAIDALSTPLSDLTDQNIVEKIKQYEKNVEFGRLVTDFAEIFGKFVGSEVGKYLGMSIGAAIGSAFTGVFPPAPLIGAVVGYLAGGYIGGELVGKAARAAAEIMTSNFMGEPLLKKLQELGIPPVSAKILEIYSEGRDYDVSSKEKVYIKIMNNDLPGAPEREFVVCVNPSHWEVTDYWDLLDLELLDFDNAKTIKLKPGESGIVWFTVKPDGVHVDENLTFLLFHKEGWLWWSKWTLLHTYCEEFHGKFAFIPIDMVLVMDRSGSMADPMGTKTKIQGAKDSATAVIDSLMPVDRIAIVSFSSDSSIDVPLTTDFEYAKNEITKFSAGGSTSFGAGLSSALKELKTNGDQKHAWAIIFMSDGLHNTDPSPDLYVLECKGLNIPIYTIGLGSSPSDVNETMLKWMADETGGKYLFAPSLYELQNIFVRFSLEVTGWKPSAEFSGIVYEGQTVVAGTFEVAPFTFYVKITLNWPGSDLDLVIVRPDGSEVDLLWGFDNIYSGSKAKPEWVILLAPQKGMWTVKVYGKSISSPDENYTVWVSNYSPPVPHDETPPVSSLVISHPKFIASNGNLYVSGTSLFTIMAEDNPGGVGVASTFYRINNVSFDTDWIEYLTSFQLKSLTDGNYNLAYYSVDGLGNAEPTNQVTIYLDNSAPSLLVKLISTRVYAGGSATFNLTVYDDGSGVSGVEFYVDGELVANWTDAGVYTFNSEPLREGKHSFYAVAFDNLGNNVTTDVYEFEVYPRLSPRLIAIFVIAAVVVLLVIMLLFVAKKGGVKRFERGYVAKPTYPATAIRACPVCGGILRYDSQQNKWYCDRCKRYY